MIEISVIIPTHNRCGRLGECLAALGRQTQPAGDYEVIVVDDGSTDGTSEALARMRTPYPLRALRQEQGGPGAARNRGLQAAAGRFCLFLDDDVVATAGLVAAHLGAQRAGGVLALGYLATRLGPGADGFARQFAQWIDDKYARLGRGEPASFADCASGNMSAPRQALLDAGGFATDLPRYEDIELAYRLWRRGLAISHVADAAAREEFRKGFPQIARDAEASGAASVAMYRRHPAVLPHLQLGAFDAPRLRVLLLRRLLLALGAGPRALRLADPLAARRPWAGRWYSFVYDYCYWRGVRRAAPHRDAWRRLTRGTLILQYHAFGTAGERPGRFVVPAARFSRQMAWLRRWHRVLGLETYLRYRREHRLPPARSVVVTIDDGYRDGRTVAYPILRRLGLPATVFLVSGALGGANAWDRSGELAGRPLLSREDLLAMRAVGIAYGAHTRTHPHLTALPTERLRDEVVDGRRELEQAIGEPVSAFAYPYGEWDARCEALVAAAGFSAACGSEPGPNAAATPPYHLRRTEVRGTDSLLRFVLTLWLGDVPRLFDRPEAACRGGT